MTRRLTPRGEERKRQLMDVAVTQFAANGYHPTSVAEIVQAVGVGKGVFYWYFPSKDALFLEILRDAQRDLRRRQQAAIADLDDPMDRIEQGIRASMQWSAEHPELFRLFAFAETDERFAVAMRKGADIAVADASRHVKEAVVEGRIPDGDPVVLAHAMLGVAGQFSRVLIHEKGEPVDPVTDAAVQFCLGGLRGGAAG